MSESQVFLCRFLVPILVGAVAMIGIFAPRNPQQAHRLVVWPASFFKSRPPAGTDSSTRCSDSRRFRVAVDSVHSWRRRRGDVKSWPLWGLGSDQNHIAYVFVLSALLLLLLTLVLLGCHAFKCGLSKALGSSGNKEQLLSRYCAEEFLMLFRDSRHCRALRMDAIAAMNLVAAHCNATLWRCRF